MGLILLRLCHKDTGAYPIFQTLTLGFFDNLIIILTARLKKKHLFSLPILQIVFVSYFFAVRASKHYYCGLEGDANAVP